MKMIFDSVKNRENYKEHPLIYQALSYLGTLPEGELPASGQVLIPEVLFCNPVTLISRPEEECIYEAHRNYADLHYIVGGHGRNRHCRRICPSGDHAI